MPKTYVRGEHRKRDKVLIVGFAPSHKLAPFADESFEVWGLNELYAHIPRWDRWFDLHLLERIKAHSRDGKRLQSLAAMTCPVYMVRRYAEVPNSIAYPLKEMSREFFGVDDPKQGYWTNSVSYMLALAIHEEYREIAVFGVDMAADSEYCVSPETRVLTADLRWVPAGEIQVGQKIIAFDEFAGNPGDRKLCGYREWRCATVEAAQRLTRPCYRLWLEDGTVLVSSAEHRWLRYGEHNHEWRRTDQLDTRHHRLDRPSRLVRLTDVWEPDRSWEAGYLAAAVDGEGHLTQVHRSECNGTAVILGFDQRDNAMLEAFTKAMEGHYEFSVQTRAGGQGGPVVHANLKGGRAAIMRFLGEVRPPRLLAKFNPDMLGVMHRKAAVAVERAEFIGEQPVIGLKTTTGTFVAEGFASHNSYQRPSCEYMLGFARGRGIRVHLPVTADLLKAQWLYGYDEPEQERWRAKMKEKLDYWQGQHQAAIARRDEAHSAAEQFSGAVQAAQDVVKIFGM